MKILNLLAVSAILALLLAGSVSAATDCKVLDDKVKKSGLGSLTDNQKEAHAKCKISAATDRIIEIIRYVGVAMLLITFAYAGILWMRGGDPYERDRAKKIIEKGIVGGVLLVAGPSIVQWMFAGLI